MFRYSRWSLSLLLSYGGLIAEIRADAPVSFSRDVLPILSDRCFKCHGPDATQRQAELRLDLRESATADRDGRAAIVPRDLTASQLMVRIRSADPDLRMPPPDSQRKRLSPVEMAILQRWIEQGAPWGRHWSFERPTRRSPPVANAHPIDAYVRARLSREGLRIAAGAAKHTLVRRLSFDLTGLPPTRDEVEAFVTDDSPRAYPALVDRLLASPHYGERMAMWWLDAARYSDTDGYQGDGTRSNWPWRDWVVQAFQGNMPFDQFTIEQFAGDLLPDATSDQILATCFHRNHMTNGEGGRDPEESRIDYVIDRVNTTGTVWLGLTLGCAQCHAHKFDPISQREYYRLFAFFNSIDEDGKAGGGAKPYLAYRSPFVARAVEEAQGVVAGRRPLADATRLRAEAEFEVWLEEVVAAVRGGFQPWHALQARLLETVEGTALTQQADGTVQASGPDPRQDDYRLTAAPGVRRVTGLRLEVFPHKSHTDGKLARGASGEFILTDVKLQLRTKGRSQLRDIELSSAVADAEKDVGGRNYGKVQGTLDDDPRNGWTTASHDPRQSHVAVFALDAPLQVDDDQELVFTMLHRSTVGDANVGRFRVSVTDQAGPAVRSLAAMPLEELSGAKVTDAGQVSTGLRGRLLDQFLSDHAAHQQAQRELARAQRQLTEVKRAVAAQRVMVLSERGTARRTFVLQRGVWNSHGVEVRRGVPAAILRRPAEAVASRSDLARWLVSPENPLTARVVVNQLWQMLFGAGLVRTPEDFGLQGEFPTHPDLLDWLAVELMEQDWNLKHLLRLMVTSRTYRQDSRVTPGLLERDPENRLWGRGARFRLPSWMIRDAALRSSGLLNPAVGGPPVMPYQPNGVWAEMFMGRFRYQPSQGAAQYRRTLYAFWRRSAAPTFLFDSAQRRVCEVRPRQTNTPLHALTLLNDLSILEASRALARTVIGQRPEPEQRLRLLFHAILSRSPTDSELKVLVREVSRARRYYAQSVDSAQQLMEFGQPEQRHSEQVIEVAAHLVVASMLFNLDEAITHE